MFNGIRYVSIYLGNTCNFDCTYCDRGYINSIGGQTLKHRDVPEIIKFFDWMFQQDTPDLKFLTFHGGEPFLFVSRMEEILEHLAPKLRERNLRMIITSNGSKILENKDFILKYQDLLTINWSYDFNYQEVNREALPMKEIASFVRSTKAGLGYQFVIPYEAINPETATCVINTCRDTLVSRVTIIPLRHHRGAFKFKSFVEEMDLKRFISHFVPFIQTLYIHGLDVNIDGIMEGKTDKSYLDHHAKFILSPDGYIYPEFDFLEYKREEYRIGQWKAETPIIERVKDEDKVLLKKCRTCPSRPLCGLKYLYSMFAVEPGKQCTEFYQIIDLTANHLHKLRAKPTLLHWFPPDERTY